MFYIYILKSKKDGKYYIGSTNDTNRRINQHNNGQVVSTKYHRPFDLIYTESFSEEKEARIRERFLKTHKGYNELKRRGIK
jgi:putative endonuclease